ncbi:uncharacterized protein LOC133179045 [Saccostrea echinata]|uniref:uncharacterized protein LOC133179045 n=1 Tax=Saccostrea echinata TaxID=191078 RepID=UPI002A81288E|nr:uncharacterized protein LOC133179045 [Saccostrea echinata]
MMFCPDNWRVRQEVTPSKDNSVIDIDDSTDYDSEDSVYVSCVNDNQNCSNVQKLSRNEIFIDNLRNADQEEPDHPSMDRNCRAREQPTIPVEIPSLSQETNQRVGHNTRTSDMCMNTCKSCASKVFSQYDSEYKTNPYAASACSSSLDSIIESARNHFAHFYDASNDNWTLREANFFKKSLKDISEVVDKIDHFNLKYQTFVMNFNTHMINILMLNVESLLSNMAAFILCSSSIQKSSGGIALYPEDLIQTMKVLIEQSIKTVNNTWMTFLQSTNSQIEGITIIQERPLSNSSPKPRDCEDFIQGPINSQKEEVTINGEKPLSHSSPNPRDCEAFIQESVYSQKEVTINGGKPMSHSSPKPRDCQAFHHSIPSKPCPVEQNINERVYSSNVCVNKHFEPTPEKTYATESEEKMADNQNMLKQVREPQGQETETGYSSRSTPCISPCQQGASFPSDLDISGIKECVIPLQRIDDSLSHARPNKRQIERNRQSEHRKHSKNREAQGNSSEKGTLILSTSKGTQTPGKLQSFHIKHISDFNKTSRVRHKDSAKFNSQLDREIKKTMSSYSCDTVHQGRKEFDSSLANIPDRSKEERNSCKSRKKLLSDFNNNANLSGEKRTSNSTNDQSLTTFVSFVRSYVCSPSSFNVSLQVSCVERNVLARKLSIQDTVKRNKNKKTEHRSRKRSLNMNKCDRVNTGPQMIKQRSSGEEKSSLTSTPRKRIKSDEELSKVKKINDDKIKYSRSESQSAINETHLVEKDNNNNFTRREVQNENSMDSVKNDTLQNEPEKMNNVHVNKNKGREETQNGNNSCSQGLKLLEDESQFFLNKQAELTAKIKNNRKVKASKCTKSVSPSKLKSSKDEVGNKT